MKIIKVTEETHERLMQYGTKKETFEDIIKRLLDTSQVGGTVEQKEGEKDEKQN